MGLTKEEKQTFYKDNHALMGTELALQIETKVQKTFTTKKVVEFGSESEFLDLADLEERYINKPAQLANVLATAYRFTCPQRGVVLFENLAYKRKSNDAQTAEEQRQITFKQDRTEKAAKRVAVADAPREKKRRLEDVAKPAAPSLKPKQLDKLSTMLENMKKTIADAATPPPDHPEMPRSFVNNLCLRRAELETAAAELQLSIEHKSGKIGELMASSKEAASNYTAALEKITNMSEELNSMN